MKILTQVGSKDRLVEMFERVNKVKLNEDVLQNNGSANTLMNAFNELQNNTLNIKQTNNQASGDETYVELVGVDKAGNEITFRFKAGSTQGDQDGVYGINNVQLEDFIFKPKNGGQVVEMDVNALKQFNAEHGQELIDVVSEYVDVEDNNAPESTDEVYEEAIKLIDKVPYKKGTETMQTHAAYADEKPTNPDVRVQSDELSKFISEIEDYSEEQPEGDSMDLPPDYGEDDMPNNEPEEDIIKIQARNNLKLRGNHNPNLVQIQAEIKRIEKQEEENKNSDKFYGQRNVKPEELSEPVSVSPEKQEIILQAYDNLIAQGIAAPNLIQIHAEIEKMQPTPKPVEKPDPNSHMAAGKTRVYPSWADSLAEETQLSETDYPEEMGIAKEIKTSTNYPKPKKKHRVKKLKVKTGVSESTDQDKYENVVFLQGDEAYQPLEILDTKGKDAALEYLKQWHYPGEHEGSQELGHGSDDQTYEKDGYIMSWNTRLGYIGLQYDMSNLTEEEDVDEPMDDKPMENPETTPEQNGEEDTVQQLAKEKEETGEVITGGKGDGKSPLEFDADQIIKGLEVEKEHTDDPMIAIEIVLDHLTEDPEYYTEKETPEASAQFGAASDAGNDTQSDAVNNEPDDTEMTDVLLGYKPHNVGDEVDEDIIGASGAVPSVGTNPSNGEDTANADNFKKYQDYQKKDLKTLPDNEKQEFFELWNQFKDQR